MADGHRLRVPDRLAQVLRTLHPELKRKIRAGLDVIQADPAAGKDLRDDLVGLRSVRVGRFRIIYRVASRRVIDLVAVGPRRTIYVETARLIRRERGARDIETMRSDVRGAGRP
jgi:mRNA interferase RelE/StbE